MGLSKRVALTPSLLTTIGPRVSKESLVSSSELSCSLLASCAPVGAGRTRCVECESELEVALSAMTFFVIHKT